MKKKYHWRLTAFYQSKVKGETLWSEPCGVSDPIEAVRSMVTELHQACDGCDPSDIIAIYLNRAPDPNHEKR